MRLRNSIDERINPCDDFIEFACGNQLKRFEEQIAGRWNGDSHISNQPFIKPTTYSLHLWRIRDLLKHELDKPYHIKEHRSIRLAKMYWQSCKISEYHNNKKKIIQKKQTLRKYK